MHMAPHFRIDYKIYTYKNLILITMNINDTRKLTIWSKYPWKPFLRPNGLVALFHIISRKINLSLSTKNKNPPTYPSHKGYSRENKYVHN